MFSGYLRPRITETTNSETANEEWREVAVSPFTASLKNDKKCFTPFPMVLQNLEPIVPLIFIAVPNPLGSSHVLWWDIKQHS